MNATAVVRKDTLGAAARVLLGLALAAGAGLSAPPAAADELGRLFFTPQQRQELDRRRASNVQEKEAVVESSVTVNGHVARSSGKTTTWVNGVPQYDTYSGGDPARVHLQDGTVKIGQTIDRTRGEVKDGLGGGTVRVNPKPPPR
jgi:ribosome-associated protein YbcJ (S4-like RNA binding protein)